MTYANVFKFVVAHCPDSKPMHLERPPLLCRERRHTQGIYGMSLHAKRALTSGKDSKVLLWDVGSASLEVVRTFADLHKGTIKDVVWRPSIDSSWDIFATCGNDTLISPLRRTRAHSPLASRCLGCAR